MAIAVVTHTTGSSGANLTGGTYNTGSITVPANTLAIIHLEVGHSVAGSAPNTYSVSGMGLTWNTLYPCLRDPVGNSGGAAFYAQTGASPVTGSLTITFNPTIANKGINWDVVQVTGHDTTTPFRANNKVQTNGTSTVASITLPQSSLASSDNRVFYYAGRYVGNNTVLIASGWTSISTINYYSTSDMYQIAWRPDGSYAQTAQPNFQVNSNWQGFAYEINAAPSLVTIGPGADAGTGSEVSSSLNVVVTDTGTATEAGQIAATVPAGTDSGGFTETGTVSVALAGSDSGFLDEESFVSSADMIDVDTGTVTEAGAVVATAPGGADAGTLTDAAQPPGATLVGQDDGGFTESATVVPMQYHVGSDGGQLTDQASNPFAMLTGDDAGSVAEQATVEGLDWRDQAGDDAADFTEAGALTALLPVDLDTGALAEDGAVEDVTYADRDGTDSATLVEDAAVSATLADTDAGSFIEDAAAVELRFITGTDAGTLIDDAVLVAQVDGTDTGTATEAASLFEAVRVLSGADQGRLRDRIVTGRFIVPRDTATPETRPDRYVKRPREGGHVARRDHGEYVERPMSGLVAQP